MSISYFQSPALTFVLCTSLLFQIWKPIVTQKPLCSPASPSAQCKASFVVPSQSPVGTRCLWSLHHSEQPQPRHQSLSRPSARATLSPLTEISPGQDGGETASERWEASLPLPAPSHLYINTGFRLQACILLHVAQRLMPFKKAGSRKQRGRG